MTAIRATLHSYKSLATRKQLQITLEVPQEFAASALKMLGVADPSGTQWFALTRIQDAPSGATENGPQVPPQGVPFPHADPVKFEDSRRNYTRSQIAFLKTEDRDFQEWLGIPMNQDADVREAECDHRLKVRLGITSKSELDQEGPKALAFDRLLTDFSVRGIVR